MNSNQNPVHAVLVSLLSCRRPLLLSSKTPGDATPPSHPYPPSSVERPVSFVCYWRSNDTKTRRSEILRFIAFWNITSSFFSDWSKSPSTFFCESFPVILTGALLLDNMNAFSLEATVFRWKILSLFIRTPFSLIRSSDWYSLCCTSTGSKVQQRYPLNNFVRNSIIVEIIYESESSPLRTTSLRCESGTCQNALF